MFVSEETSRKVFIASFVLCALPSIVLISAAALGGSALWAFFAVAEIAQALSPASGDGGYMPSALSVTYLPAVALVGLVALWKFSLISSRYVSGGRQALVEGEGLLWSALAWAAVPTLAATSIAFLVLAGGDPLFDLGRVYLSGLPLFVPLGHLCLEVKRRGDHAEATEASPVSGARPSTGLPPSKAAPDRAGSNRIGGVAIRSASRTFSSNE